MIEESNPLLNNIEEVATTAPAIYNDLLQPTVKQTGELLAFPFELLNAVLAKPRAWIANQNYKLEETKVLLSNKLQKIERDKIVEPEDYVAIPAAIALSYSMDNETLRNLYANLLANAMNVDHKDEVHPAYIEIIKQLAPLDARILTLIFSNGLKYIAVKQPCISNSITGFTKESTCWATSFDFAEIETISISLNNLIRLGLLKERNDIRATDLSYDAIDNNPRSKEFYQNLNLTILDKTHESLNLNNSTLFLTALGINFCQICCEDLE